MKALAIMPVRNEADILPWAIRHLKEQGLGIYVIDNWSTDGSWEMLAGLGVDGRERWPAEGPDATYNCEAMLERVDAVAAASNATWCTFNDADEFRRSPRPGERLIDGFARVQAEGYNAIDHRLLLFPPTDNLYVGDPENHFRYYTEAHLDCRLPHIKSWSNPRRLVGLAAKGSHAIAFPGLRVSPEKFISKHYPIRSQAHGAAKIEERFRRWNQAERARGWHVQYNGMQGAHNFLANPSTLKAWPEKRELSVVIPSRNLGNVEACLRAIRSRDSAPRVIVVDDGLPCIPAGVEAVKGIKPFVFARNVNLGIRAVGEDDVILLNDDATLQTPNGFTALEECAAQHPEYGLIGAVTNITGSRDQQRRNVGLREAKTVCFICVYIPRSTIKAVGLLDERFVTYGGDDTDYCYRVKRAGLKLGVLDTCFVDHAALRSTFRGDPRAPGDTRGARQLLIEKWGFDVIRAEHGC